MWNGTDLPSFGHTQKLIDYAGTESLQLVTGPGSASLQATFADDAGNESVPVSATILPNTWYNVQLDFGADAEAAPLDQAEADVAEGDQTEPASPEQSEGAELASPGAGGATGAGGAGVGDSGFAGRERAECGSEYHRRWGGGRRYTDGKRVHGRGRTRSA